MNKLSFIAALSFAAFSQSAVAGEVTGGAIGFDYSAFSDDSVVTIDKQTLWGSVEYGFSRDFSVQGDLAFAKFGATDLDANNVTLHGIYHLDDATSFGAFIGRDKVESEGLTFYGAEAGSEFGAFDGEAYLAYADDSGEDGTLFGLSGMYNATEAFGFGMDYYRLDVGSDDISTVALTTEYRMERLVLSAEVGQADANGVGSESYFGFGARMTFGADRGTTFARRGLVNFVPGL
jgi:hypothetical protein